MREKFCEDTMMSLLYHLSYDTLDKILDHLHSYKKHYKDGSEHIDTKIKLVVQCMREIYEFENNL
ncbi:MAG: hypothetical protein ACR2M9_02545 [Cyanophyceae cyanobacterium]